MPASATSWPSRWPRTRIKPIAPGWTWLDLDVTRFRRGIAQANARRLRLVGYRHTHPQGVARLPGAAIAGFGYLRQGAAIRSEEHTSELQSLMRISYAVFFLK